MITNIKEFLEILRFLENTEKCTKTTEQLVAEVRKISSEHFVE